MDFYLLRKSFVSFFLKIKLAFLLAFTHKFESYRCLIFAKNVYIWTIALCIWLTSNFSLVFLFLAIDKIQDIWIYSECSRLLICFFFFHSFCLIYSFALVPFFFVAGIKSFFYFWNYFSVNVDCKSKLKREKK